MNKIIKAINKSLLIYLFLHTIIFFNSKTIINNIKPYTDYKSDYFNEVGPMAVDDMKSTGVFASVTLGQSIEEGGWPGQRQSALAKVYHNSFGMSGGSCSTSGQTRQTGNGNQFWSGIEVCLCSVRRCAYRRVYDSLENSIKDHSRNLWCISDHRYINAGVFKANNPKEQLAALKAAGYAGNPNYVNDIYNGIIQPNNLTRFDKGYKRVKPYYVKADGTCTNEKYKGQKPTVLSDVIDTQEGTGSAFTDFTTTYDGNIKEGYIYKRQKDNALIINKKDKDSDIKDKVETIVKRIFSNAGRYSNSSSGGSSGSYELDIPDGGRDALGWKQYDSNWGSIKLGSKGETIKSVGCLATSVAIQIKLSGTKINSDKFNPGTWVQYLNKHGGFSGSLFNWSDNGWKGLVPNWHLENNKINLPASKQEKIKTVKSYLDKGYYPIMCVKANCGHWVAVIGVTSDNIKIADPGSTTTTAWPKYQVSNTTRIAIFKKTDQSVLNARIGTIQGPSGKETYYNMDMSNIVKQCKPGGYIYNEAKANGNEKNLSTNYWVRNDGAKMLGDYIMVAADLKVHPRGSLVKTSLGTGVVVDTGSFAKSNPNQLDIATTW